jgi:hypothetical protein
MKKARSRIPALAATLRRFAARSTGSMTDAGESCFLPLLMGVGGLAIDLQRFYGVHGQQQALCRWRRIGGSQRTGWSVGCYRSGG